MTDSQSSSRSVKEPNASTTKIETSHILPAESGTYAIYHTRAETRVHCLHRVPVIGWKVNLDGQVSPLFACGSKPFIGSRLKYTAELVGTIVNGLVFDVYGRETLAEALAYDKTQEVFAAQCGCDFNDMTKKQISEFHSNCHNNDWHCKVHIDWI